MLAPSSIDLMTRSGDVMLIVFPGGIMLVPMGGSRVSSNHGPNPHRKTAQKILR